MWHNSVAHTGICHSPTYLWPEQESASHKFCQLVPPSGCNHGNNSLGNIPPAQSKHCPFKKYKTHHIHKGRQLQVRDTSLKIYLKKKNLTPIRESIKWVLTKNAKPFTFALILPKCLLQRPWNTIYFNITSMWKWFLDVFCILCWGLKRNHCITLHLLWESLALDSTII